MIGAFVLYLVLADKPRFEDTNEVGRYETMIACQEQAKLYMDLHAKQLGEGTQSRYVWACKELPEEKL